MAKIETRKETGELARSVPNNLEVEQAILGCILIDPEATINIVAKVKPIDFYSESHKVIYDAMLSLYSRNVNVDIITLTDELERKGQLVGVGGVTYLTMLTNVVPSAANHENYIAILRRDSTLRQLIESCNNILNKAYENQDNANVLALAEKSLSLIHI